MELTRPMISFHFEMLSLVEFSRQGTWLELKHLQDHRSADRAIKLSGGRLKQKPTINHTDGLQEKDIAEARSGVI